MSTLALIGSGEMGGTVARLAVEAGLDVVLSNSRGPDTLTALVDQRRHAGRELAHRTGQPGLPDAVYGEPGSAPFATRLATGPGRPADAERSGTRSTRPGGKS